jgi:hypothetical protein
MSVDLQWGLRGVADETPLTTTLKGTLDTTQPTVLTGTVPKVDTAFLVNGYPLVRFDQVAATLTFLTLPFSAGTTRTLGFVFRTPAAWATVAWTYATVVSGTAPQSRIVMGGTSAPGSVRLTDAAGTELTRSTNNVLALSTTYYCELQHQAAGAGGVLRLRVFDAAGLTTLYDSGSLTANIGTTCDGIQIGRLDSTPTVGAFWSGLVQGANTITTLAGPLPAPVVGITTDLRWAMSGAADEAVVTTSSRGLADTTSPSAITGTPPKTDAAFPVGGFPLVRFDQVTATASCLTLPVPASTFRTVGFVFRTPASWSATSAIIATIMSSGSVCANIDFAGTGAAGEIRLMNAANVMTNAVNPGTMSLNTTYYCELQLTQVGAAGVGRLRLWNSAGTTLLFDSGNCTSDYGTAAANQIIIGARSTSPILPTFWVGVVSSAPTISTLAGPLTGGTIGAATTLRVRGVITALGVETAAILRGVINAVHAEAAAVVREIASAVPPPPPPPITPNFSLVWDEPYVALDPTKHSVYDLSTFGAPTRIQRYLAANVVLATGVTGATGGTAVKLLSKREVSGGQQFTAGMMDTKTAGFYLPRYLRFEFRCKTPHGQGVWPAIWLTAKNGGATTAEWDILEYFHGQIPGKNSSTLHRTNNAGTFVPSAYTNNQNRTFFEAPTYDPGWHTWATEIVPVTDAGGLTTANPALPSSFVRFTVFLDSVKVYEFVDTSATWWTTNGGDQDSFWNIYTQGSQISGTWVGHPDDPLASNSATNVCLISGTYPACATTKNGYSVIRAGAAGSTATFADPATTLTVDYYRVSKFIEV